MNEHEPLVSIETKHYPYLFNIYSYQHHLVGVEEDPDFFQLFEMKSYGSPSDYFDWRRKETDFGCLLDIRGYPLAKSHHHFTLYRKHIKQVQFQEAIPAREWSGRLNK